MEFWERSGPHPSGGFTSRGAKRRVRFEKRNHAPCGCTHMHMHTLTHVRAGERAHMRTQMCVPESAHTCMCTYCTLRVHEIHAPEGCTKNITARSNLRTHVIVSKSCERRVRHACAHLRCPRVHARVYTCTLWVHVSAPSVRFTSRGAKRRVRHEKKKTNLAMRMHRRCIR